MLGVNEGYTDFSLFFSDTVKFLFRRFPKPKMKEILLFT